MSEIVRVRAAGSLKAALQTIIADHAAALGIAVEAEFGPAGFLRRQIEDGAATDLFLSANMEHPRALAASRGGTAIAFASNRLCVLVRPGLAASSGTILATMLDESVRVAISTPGLDPSGDYAFAMFERAEALVPGASARLKAKALQLVGNPANGREFPPGRTPYGWMLGEGEVDLCVSYLTNALLVASEVPGIQIITLPDALAVGADYGLLVLSENPGATRFAEFILSGDGQAALAGFGFGPPRG